MHGKSARWMRRRRTVSEDTVKNKLENKEARESARPRGRSSTSPFIGARRGWTCDRGTIKKKKRKKEDRTDYPQRARCKNKAKDAEERDRETGTEQARSCKRESERSAGKRARRREKRRVRKERLPTLRLRTDLPGDGRETRSGVSKADPSGTETDRRTANGWTTDDR